MVNLKITSSVDTGLKDKSRWVLDCAYCSACDECNPITSASCSQHVYLCVEIENTTSDDLTVKCSYTLYKNGKYHYSNSKTKTIKANSSKFFFSHGIHLTSDLCANYEAKITATIESCVSTCETTCQTSCQLECQEACLTSCEETCEQQCQELCKQACEETCQTKCQETCELSCETVEEQVSTCTETCQVTCQTQCLTAIEKLCQTECQTLCESNCELLEEIKCPIMVVSYGTPLVDSLEPLRRIRKILPSPILKTYYSDLHLKIARKFRRLLYLPLLILTKLINYISKRH